MWIRAQNGRLIECHNLLPYKDTQKKWCVAEEVHISSYREKHGGQDVGRFYHLGHYKTKKRCIEVIDDIQERIDHPLICYPDNSAKKKYDEVYKMPKE